MHTRYHTCGITLCQWEHSLNLYRVFSLTLKFFNGDMKMLKKPVEFETAFNKYNATDIIGEGGAGCVYRATDELGQPCAIKLLDPKKVSREKLKRFKNEMNFGERNNHRNIVTVADHGIYLTRDGSAPFFVMPLYDNTLRGLMNTRIAPQRVLQLYSQLLNGVEAAHLQNIIHRDLKPENMFYLANDDRLLIGDFGIAHFEQDELFTSVETRPNERLANFLYAAPEQRTRGGMVDQKADLYALGLILNEMFTHEVPQGTDYKTIAVVASELAYLDEIVANLIKQSPNERPHSIDTVKRLLIARGNEFVARQHLNQLRQAVVPQNDIDDPLFHDPISLVGIDYENGVLHMRLNRAVTEKWVSAFRNMGTISPYSALWGKGPENFTFKGDTARIMATEDEVQQVVDHFKSWLPTAHSKYQQIVLREKHAEENRQQQELRLKIAEAESRERVLRNVRI